MDSLDIRKMYEFQQTANLDTFKKIFQAGTLYGCSHYKEEYTQFNKTYKRQFINWFCNLNQYEQNAVTNWFDSPV